MQYSSSNKKIIIQLSIVILYTLIYFYLLLSPYKFSTGYIGPNLITVNKDIDFYIGNSQLFFNQPFEVVRLLYEWYIGKGENLVFYSGPLLPALIKLTAYSKEFPILLNTVFVISGLAMSMIASLWMQKMGLGMVESLLFSLCPQIILFSFQGGTDILFCLFVFSLFLVINKKSFQGRDAMYSIALLALIILLRPNGLMFIIYFIVLKKKDILKRKILMISICVLSIFSILYYFPYALMYMKSAFLDNENMLGIGESYIIRSFPHTLTDLPIYLLNSLYVVFVKILALIGIYISQSGSIEHTAIRFLFGIVLLLGLLSLILKGSIKDKLFIFLLIFPCLFGHAADRYIIGGYPVLYFYGVNFINYLIGKSRK